MNETRSMRFATALTVVTLIRLGAPAILRAAPVVADTVRGSVTDSSGQPLAGVEVLLAELSRRTTTTALGVYVFAAVPAGAYTMVFRQPGYASVAHRIAVPGPGPMSIALKPSIVKLDAVTVTATRSPADPLSTPLPTASLDAAARKREYRVSLAHALETLPGVRALTTGGEIGKPVIRGLSGARVLVLGDGNRLEDYSWSDEDGPSVEASLADRIEVIRGPASVLYGSDALGGVVNVIPEDVPDAREEHTPLAAGVEAYGASNNHEFGGALRASGATGGMGFLAGVVGRHSEALHTPLAELENTGFTALSGEAAVGTQGDWGKATARFTHYGGEFHLLEADTGSLPPPPVGGVEKGPVRKLTDDRMQLGGTFPIGRVRVETKGQWQRHWLAETVEGDTASTEKGFDLLLNTLSLDVLAHHDLGARVAGTIGASTYYQTSATRGAEPLVPGARASGAAAFAFEQLTLNERWGVLAGARVDLRRLDADSNTDLAIGDQRRNYTAWSGDVGLVFRPAAELALSANVGRAWRAPTLFELFTNGPHPGEARFEIGRADLAPEAGLNLDVGARWQANRVRGEVSAFSNRIDHFIYIAPTGTTQDSLPVYLYVQADARLVGGEASLEVAPWSVVALSARVDYVRGERRSDREPLPQIPPLRVKLGAEWHGAGGAGAGLDIDLVARQTRLSAFDQGTAGYGLLDLFGHLEPRLGRRPLHLELQVRNVFNTSYRDFLSRYKAFALNPGRNIVLRVGSEL